MAIPWKKIAKFPLLLVIEVAKLGLQEVAQLLGKASDDVSKWQKKNGPGS